MEKSRAALSHFGGIIRLVILIILVALIAFIAVRFIKNRQDTKTAERASQSVSSNEDKSNAENSADKDSADQKTESDSSKNEENGTIPSGVADNTPSGTVGSTTNNVPAAGMGTDILLTTFILASITFFYVRNRQLKLKLGQVDQS